MARTVFALVLLTLSVPSTWAQISVSAPSGTNAVGPANDYATRVLHDPWDMDSYTDLGWFTLTLGGDAAATLANPTVSNGIFTGTPTNDDPSFWLLDTYLPGTVGVTKVGRRFPIDASVHRVLVMRMRISDAAQAMQIFWSNNTIFTTEPGGGYRISNATTSYDGWFIYIVDLVSLGTAVGPGWSGSVDSLRIDPTPFQSGQIQVDWARLVELNNGAHQRTVQWTGTQVVDIYLDDDTNEGNGTLGQVARSYNGGAGGTKSFDLYAGGLEPGDYYVGIRGSASADPLAYSPGFYRVLAQPWLTITAPSPEGSNEDFAATELDNPWDMDSLSDVDLHTGNSSLGISTIAAVDEAGESLGSVRVLNGVNLPAVPVGDPTVFFLWTTARGEDNKIDTNRYRILTFDLNLPGPRDMNVGSGARVVWRQADQTAQNVSAEIVVNHRAGVNVMARLTLDMETLPLEESSPSMTGWTNGGGPTPGVDSFRLDPHEFPTATAYNFRNVKLVSLDRAATTFKIKWAFANPSGLATSLSLFADTDEQGCDGLTIATGLNPATGSYIWTLPGGFSNGQARYVCARIIYNASVVGEAYSRFPLLRDLTYTGAIFSDGFESGDTSAW
jgi:hypothetical protein